MTTARARANVRRKVGVLSISLLILSGVAARASDAQHQFAVHGAGAETCQQMMDSVRQDHAAVPLVASWIFGYLTAVNRLTPDRFDVMPFVDPQTILDAVYAECERNPTRTLEVVTTTFLNAVAKAGVRTDSPVVTAEVAGKQIKIRAETLTAMQSALAAMGRYDGKLDGMFGPKLEAALRAYQRQEKLPETGLPDASTLLHLLVEPSPAPPPKK